MKAYTIASVLTKRTGMMVYRLVDNNTNATLFESNKSGKVNAFARSLGVSVENIDFKQVNE